MNLPFNPSTLLAAFASAFSQTNRLLTLRFAAGSGLADDALLLSHIEATEGLSRCYQLNLTCLSPDTDIELKSLMGQAVDIEVLLADGGYRVISGVITQTRQIGSDGGFSQYGLLVEPVFATLTHRQNARVFQDKRVDEIVSLILDEHIAANPIFAATFRFEFKLDKTYPQRSYCLQYRESDLDFIQRLLAEEGISYTWQFEHAEDEIGLHTLVLFDDAYTLEANPQADIRFHRADATETTDTLLQWNGTRSLQAGQVMLASYDYKPASKLDSQDQSYIDPGEFGASLNKTLEHYDPQSLYYGQNSEDMARYASLRQQALDLATKSFTGQSGVRSLLPGTWFNLKDHPIHDQDQPEQRQFIVTQMNWQANNNLPGELKNLTPDARSLTPDSAPYTNTFQSVRRATPIVPEYSTTHAKPKSRGMQTATVVGPEGEQIYTDAMGRIKVQFHWQRTQDHRPDQTGSSANFDDKSSCWVRVVQSSAGANWGHVFIPRIGQEVTIDFIEGDIDRPICTGVIYNGRHMPATFSGAGSLPNNKTLSGIKTQEYKGSGYNELILDDSTNELRTRLSSEHAKTQLNQGYLIHPRTEGKGEPRGEGFELRTDAAGAIRAPQGLILTADARRNASGKQLDRSEATSQFEASFNLANQLAEVAAHQLANKTETGQDNTLIEGDKTQGNKKATGHQNHLKDAIESLEKGTNTDKDGKLGTGDQPGQQGILLATAPAGIALTTPNSTTLATGTNFDQVAQRDTNQSTGRRWIHNVGESISLFVAGNAAKIKTSLKLIAVKGKIQVQAQSNEIEITAEKQIVLTSVKQYIQVQAKDHLTLTSGGAYIKISKGNIEIHAPGKVSIKGTDIKLSGPASMNANLSALPKSDGIYNEAFRVLDETTKQPLKNVKYRIESASGKVFEGITDAEGQTNRVFTPKRDTLKLFLLDD